MLWDLKKFKVAIRNIQPAVSFLDATTKNRSRYVGGYESVKLVRGHTKLLVRRSPIALVVDDGYESEGEG